MDIEDQRFQEVGMTLWSFLAMIQKPGLLYVFH